MYPMYPRGAIRAILLQKEGVHASKVCTPYVPPNSQPCGFTTKRGGTYFRKYVPPRLRDETIRLKVTPTIDRVIF
jgi:hypothetical protein